MVSTRRAVKHPNIAQVFREIGDNNHLDAVTAQQWYLTNILEGATRWYNNFYCSATQLQEFQASLSNVSRGRKQAGRRGLKAPAATVAEWWDDFLEAVIEDYAANFDEEHAKTYEGRHKLSISHYEATWADAIDVIYAKAIRNGVFEPQWEADSRERIFKTLRCTYEDLERKGGVLRAYFNKAALQEAEEEEEVEQGEEHEEAEEGREARETSPLFPVDKVYATNTLWPESKRRKEELAVLRSRVSKLEKDNEDEIEVLQGRVSELERDNKDLMQCLEEEKKARKVAEKKLDAVKKAFDV